MQFNNVEQLKQIADLYRIGIYVQTSVFKLHSLLYENAFTYLDRKYNYLTEVRYPI